VNQIRQCKAALLLLFIIVPIAKGAPGPTQLPGRIIQGVEVTGETHEALKTTHSEPQHLPEITTYFDKEVEWVASFGETCSGQFLECTENRAYVVESSGIRTYDISELSQPKPVSNFPYFGPPTAIARSGDHLYRAAYPEILEIYELTGELQNPVLKDTMALGRYLNNTVFCSDTILCVANGPDGFILLDVTSPLDPVILGTWTEAEAYDVRANGDIVYALGWEYIWSVSIVDPHSPATLGRTASTNTNTIEFFDLHDSTLVCGTGNRASGYSTSFVTINTADPEYLEFAESYPYPCYVMSDCVNGDGLYYASVMPLEPTTGHNLFILDLSDPDSIAVLDSLRTEGGPGALALFGDTLVLAGATSGFQTFTLSDPLSPELLGRFLNYGGRIDEIALHDTLAILSDTLRNRAISFTTLSDFYNAEWIRSWDLVRAPSSIQIDDTVFTISMSDHGIFLYDLGSVQQYTDNFGFYQPKWGAEDIEIIGDVLFYTEFATGFNTVDISDPNNPIHLDTITPAHRTFFTIQEDVAYVSGITEELLIVDVSDPTSLELLGTYSPGDGIWPVQEVLAVDNYLIVPLNTDGFRIVDVSNPLYPIEIFSDSTQTGFIQIEDPFLFAVRDGNLLYSDVILSDVILTVYDISDMNNPHIVHRKRLQYPVFDIVVKDGYLYVAETESVNIYKLNLNPDSVEEREPPYLASRFDIEGVYPNPFNPSTTIEITLPEAGWMSVDMFNLLGQRVLQLYDGPTSRGRHKYLIDGTNLGSGIYFVRVSSPRLGDLTTKITLVK
jgi:hypothetical protein